MHRERALTGAAKTLLITLYVRARDAASSNPILGDRYAARTLERLGVDTRPLAAARGNTAIVAVRGALLDRWTQEFLDAHPNAQILHLGCGLDSRSARMERPATSRWVDLDVPEVVEVRREVCDEPEGVRSIASSVTDERWWDEVDTERPTLIVAEGLLMYLGADDVHALLDRAVDQLHHVELAHDVVAPWMVWLSERSRLLQRFGVRFGWAPSTRDELARRHPGARLVEDLSVVATAATTSIAAPLRLFYRLAARVPALRDGHRVQYLVLHRRGNPVAEAGQGG